MKVLYYNWTPLDLKHSGGGVSIYLYNLLQFLSVQSSSIHPVFLSSGYFYDNQCRPYIAERESCMGIKNFCLVNSPIIAPHLASYSVYRKHLDDEIIIRLFRQFLFEHGPFDVIHFHSFEGLTTRVLQLKSEFPKTRFIHTVHDYGLFCPTVRFWTHDAHNCALNKGKVHCHSCIRKELTHRYTDSLIVKRMIDGCPHKMSMLDRIVRQACIIYNQIAYKIHDYFEDVRRMNLQKVNTYLDVELCVSRRVKEIITCHGVDASKCVVSYIGTQAASSCIKSCRTSIDTPIFTVLFMGSAAPEKGLDVLLSALELIDSSKYPIALKIAAGTDDASLLGRIDSLRSHLTSVIHYNGYSHQDFDKIMQDVNLGIVPSLWEDNLPQVAIEMIANGIPVLTSTHGGTQELNSHPDFLFSDTHELKVKIEFICSHRHLLSDYWLQATPLTTMEQHVRQLIDIYGHES